MLDEMFEELQAELQKTQNEMKDLKRAAGIENVRPTTANPAGQQINSSPQKDEFMMRKAPAYSISKSQRFPKGKEDTTAQSFLSYQASRVHDRNERPVNVIFPQTQRFKKQEKDDFRDMINPNFNAVKPQAACVIINPPTPQKSQVKGRLNAMRDSTTLSNLSELETQASVTQEWMGPAKYNVNYQAVEVKQGTTFSKTSRFKKDQKDDQLILNPNFDAVLQKAPATALMKSPQQQTAQQKMKEKQQEIFQLQSAAYAMTRKIQDPLKQKVAAAVAMQRSVAAIHAAPHGSKQRRMMMFALLDQLREDRARGPAEYEAQEEKPAPCAAVYHKSLSPTRKLPEQSTPGPDYYYWKDDLTKDAAPAFTIPKQRRSEPMAEEDLDFREYIDTQAYQAVKKRVPQAAILPEHEGRRLLPNEDQLADLKRGPGMYEVDHTQVQKRDDLGVVKMAPLNDQNSREYQMDPTNFIEKYEDIGYYPNLDVVRPHVAAFQYHEPSDDKPAHIPDDLLLPEQWKFYDVDINQVREDTKKGGADIGGGYRDREAFAQHEEFLNLMHSYLARDQKQPEVGQYDPSYKQIDPDVNVRDFDQIMQRNCDPIVKPEGDLDGDNLILNPDQPKQHLPDIQLDKMGKPVEKETDGLYHEELLIDPQDDIIKPKVKGFVEISKMLERPEEQKKEEEHYKEELLLNVKFDGVEPKIKGNVDFQKQYVREDDPNYVPKQQEAEAVIDIQTKKIDQVKPRSDKGGVKMSKGAVRFKENQIEKSQKN